MEVHHAGHGERPRSFKSFAFEFLMISIAVFVGSLGEYFSITASSMTCLTYTSTTRFSWIEHPSPTSLPQA